MTIPEYASNAVAVGERVFLRPLEVSDAETLSRASHLEPEVAHADAGRVPTTVLAFAHWIEGMAAQSGTAVNLAICRISDGACIGTTAIRDIDWVNRTGETGTGLLDAEDRGRGLGSEAKHLLLRYCFEQLGLHAIRSFVYSANTRSAAALRKQGYRFAGTLSAQIQRGGVYHDDWVFDLLRPDWEAAYAVWKAAHSQ